MGVCHVGEMVEIALERRAAEARVRAKGEDVALAHRTGKKGKERRSVAEIRSTNASRETDGEAGVFKAEGVRLPLSLSLSLSLSLMLYGSPHLRCQYVISRLYVFTSFLLPTSLSLSLPLADDYALDIVSIDGAKLRVTLLMSALLPRNLALLGDLASRLNLLRFHCPLHFPLRLFRHPTLHLFLR